MRDIVTGQMVSWYSSRALLPAILLLLAPAACKASSSEADFATDMLPMLQAAMPEAKLASKVGEPLVITLDGAAQWKDAQINLHNLFRFCRNASQADCETSKSNFVAKITKPPVKPTRDSLRVVVRDQEYANSLIEYEKSWDGDVAIRDRIGDDLYVLLAFDTADSIGMLSTKSLDELGLSQAEAWQLAKQQTAAQLPQLPTATQLTKNAVGYEDKGYLGSLLVNRDGWAKLADEVGPDLFVTVVSDQFVFVGKMPAGPAFERFRQTVVDDCASQERCISPNVYRFKQGRWVLAP